MSIERTYHCDGPDCERHGSSVTPPPYIPWGFLEVRQSSGQGDQSRHFCGWDCVMKFAATFPAEEVIPLHPPTDPEGEKPA